jgi:hypothetical protein
MTSIRRTVLFVTSVITLALLVFPVFAQVTAINTGTDPCGLPGVMCDGTETFVGTLLPFVVDLTLLIIVLIQTLSVIFLVIAGIQYITSLGDPEKTQKAKTQALYSILGLILASSAFLIIGIVSFAPSMTPTITILAVTNLIRPYLSAVLGLMGFIATIYIVIGGYNYISSQGDEQAVSTAKKQILYAIIGLVIAGLAEIIITAVTIQDASAIMGSIRGIINAFLGLASIAATAYVILGGVMYFMSQGDQEKTTRAKMQILYALIGLFIIIVSGILVNFIIANY